MCLNQESAPIFDTQDGRSGFLRPVTTEMKPGKNDVFVAPPVALTNRLRNGSVVSGQTAQTPRGVQLSTVESVNGLPVTKWKSVPNFDDLTPVHPHEQIVLGQNGADPSMRIVDLLSPIGKGQRALIVAPPRSGKTRLISRMASSISKSYPDIRLVVLLLDERPEEVTEMVRSVNGQVFASSSDQDVRNHIRLAKLALDYAKRWAEVGSDVVLLMDSLTRLGRSANLAQSGPGRTLSGGVDTRALELPRRIFGAARQLEEAGSITIVATALVETNSRMDDFIYQDFKGTGNCEIVLRRDLSESRIYPAIDTRLSGTRNEEAILGSRLEGHRRLRRVLYDLNPIESMTTLLRLVGNSDNNAELLSGLR